MALTLQIWPNDILKTWALNVFVTSKLLFDIFVYVDVYLDIWDYNMELDYWKWVVFKFASVWDCKICISKWIHVKCLEIEIKTARLFPRFYMSVWWKLEILLIVKIYPYKV